MKEATIISAKNKTLKVMCIFTFVNIVQSIAKSTLILVQYFKYEVASNPITAGCLRMTTYQLRQPVVLVCTTLWKTS